MDYYLSQIILISGLYRPANLDYKGMPYLLACDGSFYPITTYSGLYYALSERADVTLSSDGLKFAVPNLPNRPTQSDPQGYYGPRYYIVANPNYPFPAVL